MVVETQIGKRIETKIRNWAMFIAWCEGADIEELMAEFALSKYRTRFIVRSMYNEVVGG